MDLHTGCGTGTVTPSYIAMYSRGGFGIRNHAGVIFWELKNVFKEPLIKYFSKKLQNEATHAILETVSGSNFYMK